MQNRQQKFVSIIWGYHRYFYSFAKEEHYHLHALKIARDLNYETIVLIKGEKNIIENDPLFDSNTKVIYYSNIFQYIFLLIKFSSAGSIFYVNSVEPQSLIVPFLARKSIFMGHTHPVRQTWLKQKIFNFSMKFFARIRLNNADEKDFLIGQGLAPDRLWVVPLSVSFANYRILEQTQQRKDFVYFGNIVGKKNIETIIRASNLVCEKYPDVTLHLVGREYYEIDKKIISQHLKIVRHGFIEKASDVNTLLNKYLAYLNSSFDEGMCVAVYNASLSGCALCLPQIMSFTGVFKDKALFHETTDFEQLAENMIFYIKHPEIAAENNRLCREMIKENYSYEKISAEMESLFTF